MAIKFSKTDILINVWKILSFPMEKKVEFPVKKKKKAETATTSSCEGC